MHMKNYGSMNGQNVTQGQIACNLETEHLSTDEEFEKYVITNISHLYPSSADVPGKRELY